MYFSLVIKVHHFWGKWIRKGLAIIAASFWFGMPRLSCVINTPIFFTKHSLYFVAHEQTNMF